ncbi:type IV pilus modification protein PilV [Halopseudomonas laoshanensis]|uniref:Type IV pilus modification protein PilV n=1 Tax=Halopseudomonas laoshanensis TaxID=2268758 RepID=A0A7V7GU13_9GAMM|nr:type IV pilus modification protein PilV [Halopseudomonas laoshanensis]KAA0694957.1 type IV pilus modification protein PilV [Halopseudomonas laoshanensis]
MMIGIQPPVSNQSQQGISLIEVLITVLVLSVGLLGLAGLQLTSLRNNQSAMERSVGVVQSYSIIEAIRADPDSAKANRFDIALDAADPTGNTFPANSLSIWREQIQENLGADAVGAVSCNNIRCTVIVQWDDSKGTDGRATQQIITEVHL